MRHTKIVATIGPTSENESTLKEMIKLGLNVARLNFSHGTYDEHLGRIKAVRHAAAQAGKCVAILLDTRGPEIRLGVLENEPIYLRTGDKITLTTEDIKGHAEKVSVTYKQLPQDVNPDDSILLSDGLISLKVLEVEKTEIHCEINNGGELRSRKGVNVPGVSVNLPAVTDQDIKDIRFGIANDLDFIAASFVRKPDDILTIRKILEDEDADLDIIAKIENQAAVNNLDDIIKVADGIMVARGDLGVEIPAEEVPLIQKIIIDKCNRAGKPVITATQMLESMIDNPRPTRAEASDVANAILDGTDAVMLSGETAAGKYPVQAVATMSRIAISAEEAINFKEILVRKGKYLSRTVTDAISYATCSTAHDLEAAAIISSTESGYTPKMVSKYKPKAPIIAVTPHAKVLRKLSLAWGVQPLLVSHSEDTDTMISNAVKVSLEAGLISAGDLIVITAGVPVGVHGTTNLLKVHTVGDILAKGSGVGARAVTGTVRIASTFRDAVEKVQGGDILVAITTEREFMPAIEKAAALITEVGGLTSHAAIVGLEFGIPVIVGVEDATKKLSDGQVVTIDGQRGLIYAGPAKVL